MDVDQEAALEHGWDEAPEGTETGPRVTVTLPDQQPLVGQLLEQRQGSGGDWFCLVALSVWEHVRVQDADAAQATSIITPVPARYVERIEGEDYVGIPTYGHGPAHARERQEAAAWGKRTPVFRMQYLKGAGPSIAHVDSCSVLPRAHHDEIPVEQLDAVLSDPDREAYLALCNICRPGRVLTRVQESRGEGR